MKSNAMLVINTNKVMSENTRLSMKDACNRWDCDFVEITEHISPRHHASLKLKAFDFCPHNRILVIDSDTCISRNAPNLFALTTVGSFYAVKNQQPHYPTAYNQNVGIAEVDIRKILGAGKINTTLDITHVSQNFFNSGVVVVSRNHEEVLSLAYYLFVSVPMLQWWDQIPLNIAAFTILGGYNDLGSSWNYQFPQNKSIVMQNIYHFAGDPSRYDILKTIKW